LIRGRGIGYIREASPLFDSPSVSLSFKEEGDVWILRGLRPFKLLLINDLLTRLWTQHSGYGLIKP